MLLSHKSLLLEDDWLGVISPEKRMCKVLEVGPSGSSEMRTTALEVGADGQLKGAKRGWDSRHFPGVYTDKEGPQTWMMMMFV